MKVVVPPIKSQGIKTKLVPWILSHVPKTKGRWIEPFVGTGVVGFNAKFKEAIFGDLNPHIIRFYLALQKSEITPESVREFLRKEGNTLKDAPEDGYTHYRFIRERFNKDFAPLDFLFLSRAGFNGMVRFSKKGNWNIPFCKKPDRFRGSHVTKIANQVQKVKALMTDDWQFLNQPFAKTIALAKKDDIIYCDPPYLGRHSDYYSSWDESHEKSLFECLSATKAKFILSTWHGNEFRQNLAIEKFWNRFHIVTRQHFYHAGAKEENRRFMTEALVMNFDPTSTKLGPKRKRKQRSDPSQTELVLI